MQFFATVVYCTLFDRCQFVSATVIGCPLHLFREFRSAPIVGMWMLSVPPSRPRSLRSAASIFVSTMPRCLKREATFTSLVVRLDASRIVFSTPNSHVQAIINSQMHCLFFSHGHREQARRRGARCRPPRRDRGHASRRAPHARAQRRSRRRDCQCLVDGRPAADALLGRL